MGLNLRPPSHPLESANGSNMRPKFDRLFPNSLRLNSRAHDNIMCSYEADEMETNDFHEFA